MAEYNGVHAQEYKSGGVTYTRLWWYTGQGSKRSSESLGARSKLTKAQINRARLDKERELTMKPGRIVAGESPTIKAWLEQYLEMKADLAEGTKKQIRAAVKLMDECPGGRLSEDRRLDRITKADAMGWRTWLTQRGTREVTVCKQVRSASALFSVADELDLIQFNPFAKLKKNVKTAVKGYPELSDAEVARLIDASPSAPWRAMLALCLHAGLRRGEALAITWADIQWDTGRMRAPNIKTSDAGHLTHRECRMEPELEAVLLECMEQADPGEARCAPLPDNNLIRSMKAIIKRAGLDAWAEPFQALRRRRDSTWKLTHAGYIVDIWLGHSAAVSAKNYLSPPESAYARDDSPRAKIKASLDRLTDEQADRVATYIRRLESINEKRRKIGAR